MLTKINAKPIKQQPKFKELSVPKTQLTGKQSDFLKIVVAAAGRGDLDAVKQFLNDKPEWLHTIGSHGRTMLWEAAYRGKLEVVKYLVEQGANINLPGCHLKSAPTGDHTLLCCTARRT